MFGALRLTKAKNTILHTASKIQSVTSASVEGKGYMVYVLESGARELARKSGDASKRLELLDGR